jgi:glycogen debranching enzyme
MAIALVRPETLYAWAGPSLLITSVRGACGADQGLSGFYHREARFLRTLRLEITGEAPWLCEAAAIAPDTLTFNYVHPEIREPGGGGTGQSGDEETLDGHGIPERALDIRLTYTVRVDRLDVSLIIANRATRAVTIDLAWILDADYFDILEAQVDKRKTRGDLDYRTDVQGEGWTTQPGRLTCRAGLAPRQELALPFQVTPIAEGVPAGADARDREQLVAGWRSRFTRIRVPGNRRVEQVLANNIRDIASFPLLDGRRDEWLALQAGMPLYPAFFGRDAVTAGWMTGMLDHGESLDAALRKLARLQSDRHDDWHDEQPGRIPYQVRTGPLALLNINPYAAYYADYASPLMFVIALANLYAWTGDAAHVRRHWDAARRILDWARTYGDADGDGYLEYQTRSSEGTKNQGWKDSGDAIIYDDGTPVPPPIGTCELQGYWYIAQELMAMLSAVMREPGDARAHHDSAAALKARFNRDWWVADEQFFALALDPGKRQVRAVTSNVGHCLATGVIDEEHLAPVVGRMFAPDLFSGWGVRTLSTAHAAYNPLSYHRGTVWAVEQGTILFGLRRFGFDARALDLAGALVDLAQLYPEDRIPECVGGYARSERAAPGAYPRANTPQLWNATAFPLLVQTLLGLVPLAPAETLIIDPALPTWLPDMEVHGLRVGRATVSLRVWRDAHGRSRWRILEKHGTLRVIRQPAPESTSAGLRDRAAALIETLAG